MRRAALWEASLRYAPFGFPKHKGTPIQNCIQSSCTTVYNLALDRGADPYKICANIVRLTVERNNNGKKIKPFLKIFERWGFKGKENFLKKSFLPP